MPCPPVALDEKKEKLILQEICRQTCPLLLPLELLPL
jgi:hypothetical protein